MKKVNIPILIAMVLLSLTLISTYFTSGLYARYTEYAEGSDSGRVAQFQIETDLDYVTLGIANNETPSLELGGEMDVQEVSLPFYIESRSEVTACYSVKVDFGAALPAYVTLTLTNGTDSATLTGDGAKTVYEFQEFGTIASFVGTDSDAANRCDLELVISIEGTEQITEEIVVPTAKLTVRVDQAD